EAYRSLAHLGERFSGRNDAAVIEKLLEQQGLAEEDLMHLHFALGKIYDDRESYAKAFEHYRLANGLMRKTFSFDLGIYANDIERLIGQYSLDFFRDNAQLGNSADLPLFILGMPRSGTTLVEQIVSSHPRIHGAGELAFFTNLEQTIAGRITPSTSYPECMADLDEQVAGDIAGEYLMKLRSYSTEARYVTDKMPGNYIQLGLIKLFFPRARIIHCHRNPLDTCLSIYFQHFAKPNSYSYDLRELGKYYSLYEKLMAHWRTLFSGQMLEVEYEELVMNQEKISRRLIDFLGLEWSGRCLSFHENARPVKTASNVQVRQPMYTRSMGRWKNYAEFLGLLMEELDWPRS
ncbi:MAG: sulfotransferase, partial [Gammaproteobacteria bacterium]|nr:sulfotransferase [Gammaproteobacteria bacterium]